MATPTLREAGIDNVLAADTAINRNYAGYVREAVDEIAGRFHRTITADDVRSWIEANHPGAEPHHPNVLPGAMQRLAAAGRLIPDGWMTSTRPEARGRVLRVWRVRSAA